MLDGVVLTGRADTMADERDRAASSDRLAATLVRRMVLTHTPCAGDACLHRNHRRDRHHVVFLCDALGRPPTPATPEDYLAPVSWTAVSRKEAQQMRGQH